MSNPANVSRIRRDVLLLLIGAAMGTLFGILVAYPEMLASTRENAARIDANQQQIEVLQDVHPIQHKSPISDEG